ncbi:FG-GAP repeat domain-containing protein, partial [Candidatus Eisenbacteria bacterium]
MRVSRVLPCCFLVALMVSIVTDAGAETAFIPPIQGLSATAGPEPGAVTLQWNTPLFEFTDGDERMRAGDYEFCSSSEYVTPQSFDVAIDLNGSMPPVSPESGIAVTLDLIVQNENDGSSPAYTVSWDSAYLQVWLRVGITMPNYASVGYPLSGETIDISITKETDPSWEVTHTLYTNDAGFADWTTGDICSNDDGEYYTFVASWTGHKIDLAGGLIIPSQSASDTEELWMIDEQGMVAPPTDWTPAGVTQNIELNDLVFTFHVPAGAVGEDTDIALSEPLAPPPPDGMEAEVPGAMVVFELEKTGNPELALPVKIRVDYPPERLLEYGGIAECDLHAYRYDEDLMHWVLLPGTPVIDRWNHAVTFETSRVGIMAVAAEGDGDLDGLGNLQESVWGTSPSVGDSDGDGFSDGDEIWWTKGDPTDVNKLSGANQLGFGDDLLGLDCYWIAGRIVTAGGTSQVSTCAYVGPPIDVSYGSGWSGPPLFKSDGAWGDFDGDGDLDLVLSGESDGTPITRTYENVRSGMLERQTLIGLYSEGSGHLAWGDCDGDGDLDLAVAGRSESDRIARLYRNDGTGQLTWDASVVLTGVANASLAWADYDRDRDLDLLLMGNDGGTPVTILYANDGTGLLIPDDSVSLTGLCSGSADWGDYDRDGDPDLLLTGNDGTQRRTILYRNHPCGVLTDDGSHDLPGVALSDVEWGDMDRDGDLDLAFTGETSAGGCMARVYRNDGGGTFAQVADVASIYRSSCCWGDVDLDGDLDVAFCGYTGTSLMTGLYENTGSGFAAYPLGFAAVREGSVHLIDADLDGDQDLCLTGADWWSGYALVYEHEGITPSTGVHDPVEVLPEFAVVHANPVGENTTLLCHLPTGALARLGIFDTSGRRIRTLVTGATLKGQNALKWDGRDEYGR